MTENQDVATESECNFTLSSHEPVAYAAHITVWTQCSICGMRYKLRICDPCVSILAGLGTREHFKCYKCGAGLRIQNAERDS